MQTVARLFPDVFDPAWKTNVSKIAERECKPRASNQNVLGYFADNELDWSGQDLHRDSNSLLDWFLLRPDGQTTAGRNQSYAFLRKRYAGAEALGAAWGIAGLRSWADLPSKAPFKMTAQRQLDCDAFTTIVADKYHAITTTAIRQNDPNHMVLGYRYYSINRPVLGSPSAWVDMIDYHLYAHGPGMHGPPLTSLSRRTTSPGSRSWFLSSAAARATLARPTRLAPGPCT